MPTKKKTTKAKATKTKAQPQTKKAPVVEEQDVVAPEVETTVADEAEEPAPVQTPPKQPKPQKEPYTYFVLLPEFMSQAKLSFVGYEGMDGNWEFLYDGRKDKNTKDFIPVRFYMSYRARERQMRIPNGKKDMFGKSWVEYLRNSPYCKGSELQKFRGTIPWYKEMKEDEDAVIAIEAKETRLEAENKAMALTDTERIAVCNLIGIFTDKPSIQKHRVLEYAGGNPLDFLELVNSPNFLLRSLIRQAIQAKVIKLMGTVHVWGPTTLGGDENATIAFLLNNPQVKSSLEQAVKMES